jgi:hypothetical protein
MDGPRWSKIESLYHAAREKASGERSLYLASACAEDPTLRSEVESLLAYTSRQLTSPFQGVAPEQWEEIKDYFRLALQPSTDAKRARESREVAERLVNQHDQETEPLTLPASPEFPGPQFEPFDDSEELAGISRFAVQERLGAGTFGVVYRVFDRERNSVVALKKLRHFDPARLHLFKREFRSLADHFHPNLVRLYELFGENRNWFFTMEFVPGVDFLTYVRPGNLLADWNRLRDALSQLMTGVRALHTSARLHRDLKPSNVLVSADGRVVILDFGLVKEMEAHFTEPNAFAGSPAYMAPEQAVGGPITVAADWYAVGVMLYLAITGRLPFQGSRA